MKIEKLIKKGDIRIYNPKAQQIILLAKENLNDDEIEYVKRNKSRIIKFLEKENVNELEDGDFARDFVVNPARGDFASSDKRTRPDWLASKEDLGY